ncbi:MAG: class I SAM-dependent methyltransferase [Nitrosopumilus sp.]|nr:class I SAM-dependent methyltransferase [Nitrosopumilus sp.]
MSKNEETISKISSQLKLETQNCLSIHDFLDLAYTFNVDEITIKPHQNKEELFMLLELLAFSKPKRIMEIGTSEGGTLFLLCKILDPQGSIFSLDLLHGEGGGEFYPEWKNLFYESFVSNNQTMYLLRENSQEKLTYEKIDKILGEQKLDFLLIDGDHSYEGVKKDFELYRGLIKKDGLIAFHDINDENNKNVEVKNFWDEIKFDYDTFEILDEFQGVGYGIGVLVNSKNGDQKRYIQFLKKIIDLQKQHFVKFRDNPISTLLWLFNQREGLKIKFPEVLEGNYDRIIDWAVKTCERENGEEKTKLRLEKFYTWYKKYKN